jgi:hypothetical protein
MRFQGHLSVVACENLQLGRIRLDFRKPGDKKTDDAENADGVEDGRIRGLLKLSRFSSLSVPRKSPRKRLRIQVDAKTRVTAMSVPTWLLIRPC